GDAIDWWMGRQSIRPNEELSWSEFKQIFLEKYVSLTYRNKMKIEFLKLEQGTDSVSVYVQKFDTYSRYAPGYVANESERVWKFGEGLKKSFQSFIVTSGAKTYAEVVEQALALERVEQGSSQAGQVPRDNRQGSGQGNQFRKSGGNSQNRGQSSQYRPNSSGKNKRKFEDNRSRGQNQQQSSNNERSQ
ncbi:retrotransposon gag domain-containing protein, partial [Klebsiella pneumoniae]|uniref:retrotransposon gag family protein n=1 Tax=Klebsiella pneumoniae TaxID=573 RepID=UPI00193AB8A5